MGILKQGLRCDCDRLREIVNRHADFQAFPGHDVWFDPCRYALRNIRDNVGLLTPELLREVNDLIVGTGHKVAGKKPGAAVVGLRLVRGGDERPLSDRLQFALGLGPLPAPGDGAGLRRLRRSRMAAVGAPPEQCPRPVRTGQGGQELEVPSGRCPGLSGRGPDDRGPGAGLAGDAPGHGLPRGRFGRD